MDNRPNLDDTKLLEAIQATVREWKDVEGRNHTRAEELKEVYQSLIRAAKKRNLTLSKEQLISQIIYMHSDKDDKLKI